MVDTEEFALELFLPYLLNRAAEESSLAFQRFYQDRYGMLRNEWRVLFHLGIFGQMTARDIGIRAKIHKTKISRAVQKLSDKRYLKRRRDNDDRRRESLALTSSGRTVYRELRKTAERYQRELSAGFSPEEFALLQDMLRRLTKPCMQPQQP